MPAKEETYCVAEVREESRDAWERFVKRHKINRTALCEVIAAHLDEDRLPPLDQLVREAADLADDRRRRG